MLRIIESFNNLPKTLPVIDQNYQFMPGQLYRNKNGRICGVIDDIKASRQRNNSIELHIITIYGDFRYADNYMNIILSKDFEVQLNYKNIIPEYFQSNINGKLNATDGTFVIEEGYKYNADYGCNLEFDCKYSYYTEYKDFQDTISSTNVITTWIEHSIIETDMFDITKEYKKYDKLYANSDNLFTNQKTNDDKSIGFVSKAPINGFMQIFIDIENSFYKNDIGLSRQIENK